MGKSKSLPQGAYVEPTQSVLKGGKASRAGSRPAGVCVCEAQGAGKVFHQVAGQALLTRAHGVETQGG